MIDYQKILNQNMISVLKDILKKISKEGLSNNNHLYVTFITNHKKVEIPEWLKKKYPQEMTIVIQYEFYDLEVFKDYFSIVLSFNNLKTKLKIGFDSINSFADPSANFGLQLNKLINKNKEKKDSKNKNNVINFSKYKKSN
mgnify:FL=1